MEHRLLPTCEKILTILQNLGVCFAILNIAVDARVTYTPTKKEEKCQYSNSTETYICSTGHCCENDTCCRKYFEEWWFWFIWAVVIILTCCCVYHHRRNRQNGSRQNNRQEGTTYAGVCNYPGPPVDKEMLGYCKLPKYQEVIRIPPSGSPPPPYTERRMFRSIARLQPGGGTGLEIMHQNDLTSSVMSLVASAFNLNFRSSTTFNPSPESNQYLEKAKTKRITGYSDPACPISIVPRATGLELDVMDSITEINNLQQADANIGLILHSSASDAAGQYLHPAKETDALAVQNEFYENENSEKEQLKNDLSSHDVYNSSLTAISDSNASLA